MPSTSKKQASFMKAVANNPKFAKKVGVPQKVGKEFAMADKKKGKYAEGGAPKYPVRLDLDAIKKRSMKGENRPAKPVTQSDLDRHARRQGEESRSEAMVMKKAKGGMMADKMGRAMKKKSADTMGRAMKKKSADTMGRAMKYAAGGLMSGHKSADGVAKKGKTKGTKVAMAKGGMAKKRYGGSC